MVDNLLCAVYFFSRVVICLIVFFSTLAPDGGVRDANVVICRSLLCVGCEI